jgi:hypothetical protein
MNHEQRIAELEKELAKLKGEEPRPSEPWPKFDPTAQMTMPPSAVAAMVAAVPDNIMRDIVGDARRSVEPRSMIAEAQRTEEPKPKGTGFIDPVPLRPPPGVKLLDEMMDVEAAKDAAMKRRGR